MAPGEPEDVFKVTDRRRRLDDDDARAQPAAAATSCASRSQPCRRAEPAGLFMMLASSAVVALGRRYPHWPTSG
jgi:hypothetical protein